MIQINQEDLQYNSYTWNNHVCNTPKTSGKLDDTRFNKQEGFEVVYLINKLAEQWDLSKIESGHKIEYIINEKLPASLKTQAEVATYIQMNWKTIAFKPKNSKRTTKSL